MSVPELQVALERVRTDPQARFAAVLAAVLAYSVGFVVGFLLGQRVTTTEQLDGSPDTEPRG